MDPYPASAFKNRCIGAYSKDVSWRALTIVNDLSILSRVEVLFRRQALWHGLVASMSCCTHVSTDPVESVTLQFTE